MYNRYNEWEKEKSVDNIGEVIADGQFIVGYRVQNAK